MDEQHPAARMVDLRSIVGTPPVPREPFDPADLLDGRRPPPAPEVAGPIVEVRKPFDPAEWLGERGQRGAFNLGSGKPLVATIGGVEVVTIPATHYAELLAAHAALRAGVDAGPLDLASGEDRLEPETSGAVAIVQGPAEVSEAHGAALDDGRETEVHDAAADAAKPKRHPRKADPVREVP